MIKIEDLQEAIAECHGVRNPNAGTCVKLAAFYIIKDHLEGKEPASSEVGYSFRAPQDDADITIDFDSGTEFSAAINGKNPDDIWPIIDELMEAVQVLQPKLYAATIRKIQD